MRKLCSLLVVFSLLMVSSMPLLSAGTSDSAQAYCPLCHMDSHMTMTHTQHVRQLMSPAMRHARIEYCGHHDINALPHLLAPHAVSQGSLDAYLMIADVAETSISVLKPRLLPFPVPPPRNS